MTAFDEAWELVKEEIGVKGTPCPQCGAQYDPNENEWTASVGYSTMFKQPYICHDCDIHWDGPSGEEREEDESSRQNWQTGRTKIGGEEFDFTMSPIQEGGSMKEMLEAMGAFMQDRVGQPGCDEAKRYYLNLVPKSRKQEITNSVMEMTCDDFIQFMERTAAIGPLNPEAARAAKGALDVYRRQAGMDEGMA
jgi:hypothetical protein